MSSVSNNNNASNQLSIEHSVFSALFSKALPIEELQLVSRVQHPSALLSSVVPIEELKNARLTPRDVIFKEISAVSALLLEKVTTLKPENRGVVLDIVGIYQSFITKFCSLTGKNRMRLAQDPVFLKESSQLRIDQNSMKEEDILRLLKSCSGLESLILGDLPQVDDEGFCAIIRFCWEKKIRVAFNLKKPLELDKNRIQNALGPVLLEEKLRFAEALLALGADPNHRSFNDRSLLHETAQRSLLQSTQWLIWHIGIDPVDEGNSTPLHFAAERGNIPILELLLDLNAGINARDQQGRTPFLRAVSQGNKENAQFFINRGVDFEVCTFKDENALHIAAHGHADLLEFLIRLFPKGLLQKDRGGNTPLHLAACRSFDSGLIDLMLQTGVDPTLLNHHGDSSIALAVRNGHNDLAFKLIGLNLNAEHVLYFEKRCDQFLTQHKYLEAVILLNVALASSESVAYTHYLYKKLEQIEAMFLLHETGRKLPTEFGNGIQKHREALRVMREEVSTIINRNSDSVPIGSKVLKYCTKQSSEIFKAIIQEAIDLLGPTPTKYAFFWTGPPARNEMGPFSSLTFGVFIESETPKNRKYFSTLCTFLALKLANSESCLSAEGNTPLGPCSIKTLAKHLEPTSKDKTFTNALSTISFITGTNSKLIEDFQAEVGKILNARPLKFMGQKERERRALELMKGCLDNFTLDLREQHIEVNQKFYKPLQAIIEALSLFYDVKSQSTVDRINDLIERQYLSCDKGEKLIEALEKIFLLRATAHLFYQTEKETLCHSKTGQRDNEGSCFTVSYKDLVEIQQVLIPFMEAAKIFVSSQGKKNSF